jgi:hypothetical protein
MITFVFRCPVTSRNVQGFFADDPSSNEDEGLFEAVTCLACNQPHLINRATHRALTDDGE